MNSELTISATAAFQQMCNPAPGTAPVLIDVRSPGEYTAGCFCRTQNLPILSDDHRHQVGLAYKQVGSVQAQKLGHDLVSGDYRNQMIEAWREKLSQNKNPGLVFCWRGGLRSQIAQQWILGSGQAVLRIEGGYKSLRKLALDEITKTRKIVTLGGPTGSGKTDLLKQIPNHVDLEALANHRGSAFGLRLNSQQPSQVNFENDLAQALFSRKNTVLLEDESRLIGHRYLCNEIYNQMQNAPMVLLTVERNLRAQNIFYDYILTPQKQGQSLEELRIFYNACVNQIRKTLGGLQTDECLKLMNLAFEQNDEATHYEWINFLLEFYYDKRYAYALAKNDRKILHQGNYQSSLEFLQQNSELPQ